MSVIPLPEMLAIAFVASLPIGFTVGVMKGWSEPLTVAFIAGFVSHSVVNLATGDASVTLSVVEFGLTLAAFAPGYIYMERVGERVYHERIKTPDITEWDGGDA